MLQAYGALVHVAPEETMLRLEAADDYFAHIVALMPQAQPWRLETRGFSPVPAKGGLGPWMYAGIDISTAAIHGDQLWARSGENEILVVKRGQVVEDGAKIPNDILDGGPVLRFFDTPYGLLAVGQGSAGIVDTEK